MLSPRKQAARNRPVRVEITIAARNFGYEGNTINEPGSVYSALHHD
jgi:hypothetical protein